MIFCATSNSGVSREVNGYSYALLKKSSSTSSKPNENSSSRLYRARSFFVSNSPPFLFSRMFSYFSLLLDWDRQLGLCYSLRISWLEFFDDRLLHCYSVGLLFSTIGFTHLNFSMDLRSYSWFLLFIFRGLYSINFRVSIATSFMLLL